MAFFSEVKAKLGLDISPFERGLKQAQTSAGDLAKGLGKQFAGTEKMAGALAAAVGLNMQSIANSIARFFTGFSTEAEQQLEDLVASSADAAEKAEASLKAVRDRIRKEEEDASEAASKRVNDVLAAMKELADAERSSILEQLDGQAKIAFLEDERHNLGVRLNVLDKNSAEWLRVRIQLLDRENAIREENKKIADDQKEVEEALTDALSESAKSSADMAKDYTDELKKQLGVLEDQESTVKSTLAEYSKTQGRSIQATTEEVRSGKRNIGARGRREVRELDKSQARLRRLEDAEQRKQEELDASKSDSERRRLTGEFEKIRTEKEAELGRSEKLKRGLEGRVSDIDTNKASLEKLTDINKGISDLNDKLESTSI